MMVGSKDVGGGKTERGCALALTGPRESQFVWHMPRIQSMLTRVVWHQS